MTIDERRVTIGLREYAHGIDVTDADLDRLEAELDERLHAARRRDLGRRPWDWAVAAVAATALVVAATALWRTTVEETMPATDPPGPITPAELSGVWLVDVPDSDGYLWHFTPDGRLNIANSPQEYVDLNLGFDRYTLERDDALSFPAHPVPCVSTVRRAGDGRMTLTPAVDQEKCDIFTYGDVWPFIRVSPASVAGTAMVRSPNVLLEERRATQSVSLSDVVGTWLLQGTGMILVVVLGPSARGEYILDDDGDGTVAPDQRGTVTVRPDGAIELRPSEGTPCDTTYSRVVSTGATLEAELADSSCGRIGAARDTWIRLN